MPEKSWVSQQLSRNHELRAIAEKYTGKLRFKRMTLARSARDDSHPHSHYVSCVKKYWRYDASRKFNLLKIASEMVLDCPDDFSPNYALGYYGQDDKASMPVGRSVPIAAVTQQSSRVIIPIGVQILASDHEWRAEKLIPSGSHRMNVTGVPGESLYSGGIDGIGQTHVSLYDATRDPPMGLSMLLTFSTSSAKWHPQIASRCHCWCT